MVKATSRNPQTLRSKIMKTTYSSKKTAFRRVNTISSVSTSTLPSKSCISSLFTLSFSSSPPLLPSPDFVLNRAFSDIGEIVSAASKRVRKRHDEDSTPTNVFISPTLVGYLPPPLPPPPSPEFLRRTLSSPPKILSNSTTNNASTSKEIQEETKKKLLSGDWIMVISKCDCGKEYSFLVNKVDHQCHKLV